MKGSRRGRQLCLVPSPPATSPALEGSGMAGGGASHTLRTRPESRREQQALPPALGAQPGPASPAVMRQTLGHAGGGDRKQTQPCGDEGQQSRSKAGCGEPRAGRPRAAVLGQQPQHRWTRQCGANKFTVPQSKRGHTSTPHAVQVGATHTQVCVYCIEFFIAPPPYIFIIQKKRNS